MRSTFTRSHPLERVRGVPLDHAALVGSHRRQPVGWESRQLEDLFGEALRAAGDAIGEDEVDVLPAEARPDLEQRTDLDRKAGLFAHLAREGVLDALTWLEVAAEEAPLRCAEPVSCEEDGPVRIDAEPDDADEEARLGAVEDAPLSADGDAIEDQRERAHQHAPRLSASDEQFTCEERAHWTSEAASRRRREAGGDEMRSRRSKEEVRDASRVFRLRRCRAPW